MLEHTASLLANRSLCLSAHCHDLRPRSLRTRSAFCQHRPATRRISKLWERSVESSKDDLGPGSTGSAGANSRGCATGSADATGAPCADRMEGQMPRSAHSLPRRIRLRRCSTGRSESAKRTKNRPERNPVRLCRLGYLADHDRWQYAFYMYGDEKYAPSLVASGSFEATPEQAFDCSAGRYLFLAS